MLAAMPQFAPGSLHVGDDLARDVRLVPRSAPQATVTLWSTVTDGPFLADLSRQTRLSLQPTEALDPELAAAPLKACHAVRTFASLGSWDAMEAILPGRTQSTLRALLSEWTVVPEASRGALKSRRAWGPGVPFSPPLTAETWLSNSTIRTRWTGPSRKPWIAKFPRRSWPPFLTLQARRSKHTLPANYTRHASHSWMSWPAFISSQAFLPLQARQSCLPGASGRGPQDLPVLPLLALVPVPPVDAVGTGGALHTLKPRLAEISACAHKTCGSRVASSALFPPLSILSIHSFEACSSLLTRGAWHSPQSHDSRISGVALGSWRHVAVSCHFKLPSISSWNRIAVP